MPGLKDLEKGIAEAGMIDISGLGGLSGLLSSPLTAQPAQHGERRSGGDRRVADRRITAPEFSVNG
jgi:hypothetical protein